VLGGGGGTGNAWLVGVVAGLLEGGVDVTAADLVVGTSAGATAPAQLAAASPTRLFEDAVAGPAPQRVGAAAPGSPSAGPGAQVAAHMERTAAIIAAAQDPADLRRRLGAAAMELDATDDGAHSARWRSIVAARLPSPDWPDRVLVVTAVDARTGEPVILDRHSGVDLVDAVAASTSSGAPYRIGERRLIDGGYRRNENADLAAGYDDVLVLSPLGGRTRTPLAWGQQLDTQVEELRAAGSRVEVVLPDEAAEPAMGLHAMNPALRPVAARAGHAQGIALAPRLAERWT